MNLQRKETDLNAIPEGIASAIALFNHELLIYNLFKCEHVLNGQNKNLDILFLTTADYIRAARLLEREGFVEYLPECIEKYKRMHIKLSANIQQNNSIITAIHLHREIAWHGLRVLTKQPLFLTAQKVAKGIYIPSPENSLLIHTAHVLFENFKFGAREREYLPYYLQQSKNWNYINQQLTQNQWKQQFYQTLRSFKKRKQISYMAIGSAYFNVMTVQKLGYIIKKLIRFLSNKISLRRKGVLIAFIGANGSGKTTAAKRVQDRLLPLGMLLHCKIHYYYFGWKPFTPVVKILSKILRHKKLFKTLTRSSYSDKLPHFKTSPPCKLFLLLFYLLNYIEYLGRYLFYLYPALSKGDIILADRYFYDVYGQYPFSNKCYKKSALLALLFKLFPKPDCIFILDASLPSLLSRGKESSKQAVGSESRTAKSLLYLEKQRQLYKDLTALPKTIFVTMETNYEEIISMITNYSWKKAIFKRSQY